MPVTQDTLIGVADVSPSLEYQLVILDELGNPLSLDDINSSHYNLFYTGTLDGLIADYNVLLDTGTGAITVNPVHETQSTYTHSGLTLFANLRRREPGTSAACASSP